MTDNHSSRRAKPLVRAVSLIISLVLVIWAFYDDELIGGGPGFGWTQAIVLAGGIVLALSCLAKLKWNSGLLAIYFSVGLTILMAELILRPILGPRYFGVFQLDDNYHYKLIPNVAREYNRQSINRTGHLVYRINSDGFRGEELVSSRDNPRIVVYGDSFIHAEFSPLDETFTKQLETKLFERVEREFEVINAGVAGYGPDQVARRMETELPRLKPDLVIVGVFAGNDYGDLIRNKLYKLDENGALQENSFVVSDEIQRGMVLARKELLLKKIASDVIRSLLAGENSAAANQVLSGRERVDSYIQRNISEFQEYVIEGDNIVKVLANDPYNADISLMPDSESAMYKSRLMARIIEKIKNVAEKEAVPLLLLIIPHPMDVLNGIHDSGEVNREEFSEYRPTAPTDILQRIALENGVDFVNLYDPFQQQDAAGLYFSGGDDHWNELGQAVSAEEVARYLIVRNLLP